ncbi:Dabb family protein [Salinimonas sp. HHU 13199]|uniref:Dabb family protein n=1 Tax=Salinimonas profundi TaxID=2729140 RepID=A0ABR8LKX3_9ALTE|nr:Dabb family protein [Salinimonas profundi]MBD3585958.1 Dabb family protein [Salinimonas profundi]
MNQPDRRKFLSFAGMAAGSLCAAAALPVKAHSDSPCEQVSPVVHMVYFWLKQPESKADQQSLIKGLNSLREIKHIQALHVGVPAATESRDVIDSSYQVSEMMMFNSIEDQDAYQSHPLHKKFIEDYSHLWKKVVVYDSVSA